MINLNLYGWNSQLDLLKQESAHRLLPHGRITTVNRTCYDVVSEDGLFQCELTGNLMFNKQEHELPCTGDWVIFQPFDYGKGVIVDILPRKRTLYRKKNGTIADKQAIAAYVDKAFIVQSLDSNFNTRRAERILIQLLDEGIKPTLVLNKADLAFDKQAVDDAIKHIAHQIPVLYTSIHHPESIAQLKESIEKGETVVLVGSSGVGKSSLVNSLCENAMLHTSNISSSTGKGRHTSTRNEMVAMESSGILVDTAGIREFGLAIESTDTLDDALEISKFAEYCRFKDCTHTNEPHCAVLNAVKVGLLDSKVYESYLKLKREANHFSSSEHEKRKREKSFSKLVEVVKKHKANY